MGAGVSLLEKIGFELIAVGQPNRRAAVGAVRDGERALQAVLAVVLQVEGQAAGRAIVNAGVFLNRDEQMGQVCPMLAGNGFPILTLWNKAISIAGPPESRK